MTVFKDLRKVKGNYVLMGVGVSAECEDRRFIGYEVGYVAIVDAWKFKTRLGAERGIKAADIKRNSVIIVPISVYEGRRKLTFAEFQAAVKSGEYTTATR